MVSIPQRELRNNVSRVLRRAESGEQLTITVDGRPVAELGPLSGPRGFAEPDRLARIIDDAPVDSGWAGELGRLRDEDRGGAGDPWSG